ncbi:DUF2459 domain-containing protein [Flavobacteriaceae bacterium AH-315-B10]|nr:DUF2459 domain-containing protein [Flavobacteriaceae bacterium AH-315-B10]
MKIVKKILKWFLYILAIPVIYLVISIILTAIIVKELDQSSANNKTIYLQTNGIHLNIIIPKNDIEIDLLKNLEVMENQKYISFGWGDENFYINTPTWSDLTFKNTFRAMFLKSTTLMHITRYKYKSEHWIEVNVDTSELNKLNQYIQEYFKKDDNGNKIILTGFAYSTNDNFYKANGSYSIFKTSNTWVNSGFKKSGLKACYWTPFDFGLINKY